MSDFLASVGGITLMIVLGIGSLCWIWVAIQIGSFAMFVIGIAGPTILFTWPMGAYMFFFGVPNWIYSVFG